MDTAQQLSMQKMLSVVDTYRATAIHLSVGNPPMMRVDGRLVAIPDYGVITPTFMQEGVGSWMDEANAERLAVNKELTIARTFENGKRFRISLFYQQGHVSAVLAVVPDVVPSMQELGIPSVAQQLVNVPSGLILITGPHGSQQSLTAVSFIEYLNQTTQQRIVTIEHPVEFLFTDTQSVIDQREVGADVHSVAQGLSFLLNEDVDTVFVSDLPDRDAMHCALELANGGKRVFAILHAKTSISALDAIIHSVPESEQRQLRAALASALVGIINQRVVPTVNRGSMLVAEVLIPNDSIRTIIQQGEVYQINNLLLTSREQGIRSLDYALRLAVEAGQIQSAVAARYALNPEEMQSPSPTSH